MKHKKLYLLALALAMVMLIAPLSEAFAATNTWTGGAGTTDWGTAGNWSSAAVPLATDDVIIPAGYLVEIPNAGAEVALSLTIKGYSRLQVVAAGTATLTIGGATTGSITFEGPGDFKVDGAPATGVRGTLNLAFTGTNANGNHVITTTRDNEFRVNDFTIGVADTVEFSGNYKSVVFGDLSFTVAGAVIAPSDGSLPVLEVGDDIVSGAIATAIHFEGVRGSGRLDLVLTGATDGVGVIDIDANDDYNFNNLTIANGATYTTTGAFRWNVNGTLTLLGNASFTPLVGSTFNFDGTNSSIAVNSSASLTFGLVTIGTNSATATLSTSSSFSIAGTGAAAISTAASTNSFNATGGTVTFTGAAPAITNAGNSDALKFYNVTYTNGGGTLTLTAGDAMTVQGDLTVSVGDAVDASGAACSVVFSNSATREHPKTIVNSGTLTFAGLTVAANSHVTTATSFDFGANASSVTVGSGASLVATAGTLTTAAGAFTVTNTSGGYLEVFNVTIGGGNIVFDAASNKLVVAGTFTPGANDFNTAAPTTGGQLIMRGSSTFAASTGVVNVWDLVVEDGSTVSCGAVAITLTIYNDLIVKGNGSLDLSAATDAVTFDGTTADGEIVVSSAGSLTLGDVTLVNDADITTSSDFTISGILTITAAADGLTASGSSTITLNDTGGADTPDNSGTLSFVNVYIPAAGDLTPATNGDFTVTGDFTNLGTFDPTDGTITFSGASTKRITNSGTLAFPNVTISDVSGNIVKTASSFTIGTADGLGVLTTGSSASSGAFICEAGTVTFDLTNQTGALVSPVTSGATSCQFNNLTVNEGNSGQDLAPATNFTMLGNLTVTTAGAGNFAPTAGTISFKGTTTQSISGTAAADIVFNNLTLDNPNGLQLNQGFAVDNLTLSSGDIDLNGDNVITVTQGSTVSESDGNTVKNTQYGTGNITQTVAAAASQSALGLSVTKSGVGGVLTVTRYQTPENIGDTVISNTRYYSVNDAVGGVNFTDFTLTYDNSELIGDSSKIKLFYSTAASATLPSSTGFTNGGGTVVQNTPTTGKGQVTLTGLALADGANPWWVIPASTEFKKFDNNSGTGDNLWTTSANWDPVGEPTANDYVLVLPGNTVNLSKGTTRYANSLIIGLPNSAALTRVRALSTDTVNLQVSNGIRIAHGCTNSGLQAINGNGNLNVTIDADELFATLYPAGDANGVAGLNFNNLTVNDATVQYEGDFTINVAGNFDVTGQSAFLPDMTTYGNFRMNGGTNQTISVGPSVTNCTFVDFTIANGNTNVTTAANLIFKGLITVPAATSFKATSGTITLDPSYAHAGFTSNGTLEFYNLSVANSIPLTPGSNAVIKGDFVKSGIGTFIPSSGKVTFTNTGGTKQIQNTSLNEFKFNQIEVTSGSNVFSQNNFEIGAGGISVLGTGTFINNNNTVQFVSSGSISKASGASLEFNHLTIGDGKSTVDVTTSSDFTVKGDLYIRRNASLVASSGNITFKNSTQRTLRNVGGASTDLTFNKVTIDQNSQLRTLLNHNFTIGNTSQSSAGIEVKSGGYFVADSGTVTFANSGDKTIVNNGDSLKFYNFVLANDAGNDITTSSNFMIKGNTVTVNTNASFIASNGTVTLQRAASVPDYESQVMQITSDLADDFFVFKNLTISGSTAAKLTTGDGFDIAGNFTVSSSASYTSAAAARTRFIGTSAQTITNSSSYTVNPPLDFGILTIGGSTSSQAPTVTLAGNARVQNGTGSTITITRGVLNLGSSTLSVGANTAPTVANGGYIDGATGTYEIIQGHTTTNFDNDIFGGSNTTAGKLYNLKVSAREAIDGNLTVNGDLTLNAYLDISNANIYTLTVDGNITRADGQKFIHGDNGRLALDGQGTFASLSNDYFNEGYVKTLVLKRGESLSGLLSISDTLKIQSGVQNLNLGTSDYNLEILNGGTIVLISGGILSQSLSGVYFPAGFNTLPSALFVGNQVGALITNDDLTMEGSLEAVDYFVQWDGPKYVTTGKYTLTLGKDCILKPGFSTAGHVIGNLRRTVTSTATAFGIGGGTAATYRPLSLQFANSGSEQVVTISSSDINPVTGRAGLKDYAVGITWNINAEGTSPDDSLKIDYQWNSASETTAPAADPNGGAFAAKWRGASWKSYRNNYTLGAVANPRVLTTNTNEYPVRKDSLTGIWSIFVVDDITSNSPWTTLGITDLDEAKDKVIANSAYKVAIIDISPAPPIATGTPFNVTVQLQNQFGQPISNTTGSPFVVKIEKENGSAALVSPPNASIQVGQSTVTMNGFTVVNPSGENNYQLRADTASTVLNSSYWTRDYWQPGLSDRFSIIGNEPSAQASNLVFTNVTKTSMTVSWSATTDVILVARAGSSITDFPVDGTTYVAKPLYGSGSTIGEGVVLYKGSGTSIDITGLSPGTDYYFRVFSMSGSDGNENYLTAISAPNNPRKQATLGSSPVDDDIDIGSNDTRLTSKTIGTNTPVYGTVKSSTDEDWFNFVINDASPNVRIKLMNLPNNYNIEMYNGNNRRIRRGMLNGSSNEAFVINNLVPGTYSIRIYGVNSVFDATNAYQLLITTKDSEIFSVTP